MLKFSATLVVVFVLTASPGGHSAPAAETSARPAEWRTLDAYLRTAARNNAGLKAAFQEWKAALERIPQVRALPDPRFNFTYYIEEVETRVGPQEQGLGLSQTFPWFGKLRLRGDAAAARAEAARQTYESVKLRLFERVKTVYYDYWFLARSIDVTRQHTELVKNLERVARSRFKTGTASHASIIRAQVELGKLDDRLRTLEALRAPLVSRLNAALNRPVNAFLPWPATIPDQALEPAAEAEAIRLLAAENPELKRLEALARKERFAERLARKSRFPDITLGVDYIATGSARSGDPSDNGKDPVLFRISMNLPIWVGKYRAEGREAALRRRAIRQTRTDTAQRLLADLKLALFRYHDAERKIGLYADTLIPKAEQSLRVTQQSFEAGRAVFLDLIDAQRVLLEFQLEHERARAERGKALALVERLINRSGTKETPPTKKPTDNPATPAGKNNRPTPATEETKGMK